MTGLIHRYREWLDMTGIDAVSLGEGNTPLIEWDRWEQSTIYLKLEGCNPTGSFKDRGMTVAVSQARHAGARAVICASTGNTAASAAAYAGRAGLAAFVVVPTGQVAPPKMLQSSAYGATMLAVEGNFDQALTTVRDVAASHSWLALVNSVNPWRLRGQETGAYELVDTLGTVPAALVIPVGNAGNISAYYQGFRRYAGHTPRMFGVQAQGADPLVRGYELDHVETVASAIRIGRPASAHLARAAVDESQGAFLSVDDRAILEAQKELARGGVFAEPASAAAYAGLKVLRETGRLPAGPVAVILTGSGLKDATTPTLWTSVTTTLTTPGTIMETIREKLDQEAVSDVAYQSPR